ncbi:pectinesterase 1 [Nicotiana sylvestris]|uniref:Pectinesterase n=1 Tax=Nicotiana sylvestris TaxID=4096 RepID=A0A1U7WGN1_NICSY|nr:PREDICTED: pectinesterase 1 [Nicotiana sylvestris]
MDTIKSFKGYGKVDEAEEQAFRKKTRKRIIILIVSAILLLIAVVAIVVGTVVHKNNQKDSSNSKQIPSTTSTSQSLEALCSVTEYKDSCISSLSKLAASNTTDPETLFILSLKLAKDSLVNLSSVQQNWSKLTKEPKVQRALEVCESVFDDAIDKLNDSVSSVDVNEGQKLLSGPKIDDLRTWLSSTLTDQETCLDALEEMNATFVNDVKLLMKNSTEYASNSLAIVVNILGILGQFNIPIHRKLLSNEETGYPEWVRPGDRRLLQAVNPKPDVTVASDGTGDVLTIQEAVKRVPKKSKVRFVIHVKAGEYVETVRMDKSVWNVMMYGDGKTKTIVSGSLNFVDGIPTFDTATFAVAGRGFIARDMAFKNTAGAAKHQAVAMRSQSDHSVFYQCLFDGFQDTLYAHSNRQFYRECDITGTIDFIFGSAAVVFQSCKIQPRQPLSNQFVTITAQGKKDPNQNSGMSIQKCDLSPLDALTAPTYLGRPWKQYSTTVIMQSNIASFLHPVGWIEWVRGVEPADTIFYAEYQNTGPGAAVAQRVKWAGYKSSITPVQAAKYTVQSLIQGDTWLPDTAVVFDSTL